MFYYVYSLNLVFFFCIIVSLFDVFVKMVFDNYSEVFIEINKSWFLFYLKSYLF